jgi:hypothetical protein
MALILLRSIANKVSSGLSPDEQHNMFRLLEEALAERRRLESQMETLIAQNQRLESHLLELKAAVQHQREIPAQVMLRRPVILIDAFEENRLPFHLEFINSFEALFAVMMVRFKHRGDGALDRIRRQMFDLYESSKQKRVNRDGPWATSFLVSKKTRVYQIQRLISMMQPGQFVEMSMLVHARPTLCMTRCPGCNRRAEVIKNEGEKVKW